MFLPNLDPRIVNAVRSLHQSRLQLVIAATGTGAGIQNILWSVPGSSATILDAILPYDHLALQDFIGRKPKKSVSEETALSMASAAHRRCCELVLRKGGDVKNAVGLGVTGAVETVRERRGADEVCIAVRSSERMGVATIKFEKGALTRIDQGYVGDIAAIDAVLALGGLGQAPVPPHAALSGDLQLVDAGATAYKVSLRDVPPLADGVPVFDRPLFQPDGTRGTYADLDPARHVLFWGSFNPLHFGHELMAAQAERMTGKEVVFAITATHPDKGALPPEELLRRAEQFRWRRPVLFAEKAALYVEKAKAFPGIGMLIGADVALGILNPRYYGGDRQCADALAELAATGARFYVVGREIEGKFVTLDDLPIPSHLRDLFVPVSGRWDVRSRDLR